MRILTVSGVDGPATFSPNPRYTLYTITGCSLGDAGPNAKVYLYQNAFRLDFQIQEWNDNGVKFVLDPNVTGVLDQVNATLVVQRADGKQTAKSGCKFYAARETRMLPHVPRANFSLNKFTPTDTSALQATYTSPSSADVAPNIGGYTAEVFWQIPRPATTRIIQTFPSGCQAGKTSICSRICSPALWWTTLRSLTRTLPVLPGRFTPREHSALPLSVTNCMSCGKAKPAPTPAAADSDRAIALGAIRVRTTPST
jgi:hypothetical protein